MTTREEIIAAAKEAGIRKRLHPEGTNEMWCMEDDAVRFYEIAFKTGAASRDAEIAQLNKEAAEKFSALAKEYDQLRAELEYDQRNAAMSQRESARLLDENTKLRAELVKALAAEQAKNAELLDFIARAQVSSGVCCCGESMDGHSSPMSCGHSPVDMWDHAVGKLLDAPSDTSALEAIVKQAGEVMRERCRFSASSNDFYVFSEAIRAIPTVTLDDLKGEK